MKRSTTKNALLMSALSLFLCFAMLTGTTFAWFTDTVESGVNQIVAGNLDVELYHNNKNTTTDEKVDGNTKLFQLSDKQLWEPGVMVYENLTVANLGNLALKYQLSVNVTNATKTDDGRTLADVLMVAVVEGGFNGDRANAEALAGYTNLASFIEPGNLYPAGNAENNPSSKTYGIVIWWQPSDEDNYYNMNNGEDALTIDLGVKLFATQLQAEQDSFGDDYDKDSMTSVYDAQGLQAALNAGEKNITLENNITLDQPLVIPASVTTYSLRSAAQPTVIDLNGKTISGSMHKNVGAVIKNEGYLVLKNGTVSSTGNNGGSALANNGTAVLENVTLNGAPNADGSWPSYTVNNIGDLKATNVKITSYHGSVASYGEGALVTLNNCEIDMAGIPGFTSHGIYTYNKGAVVVNGGTYANKATDQNSTGASVINGAVTINGGTFTGRIENYSGTPVIKGGTFSITPNSNFVADGFKAVQNADGTYTVAMKEGTFEQLISGAQTGDTVVIPEGTYTFPASDLKEGVTLQCTPGTVFEGNSGLNINGATVIGATFDAGTGNTAATGTINGTFKDCVFTGSEALRWCYSNAGDTAVFENCVIKTDFRGVHFDDMKGDVVFRNCEINGFNAIGGSGTITFENCTFGNDRSRYNGLNMYTNINLIDCTFNYVSGKTNFIDMEGIGKTLTIENCVATLDGKEASILDFVGGTYKSQTTIIVDGAQLVSSNDALNAAIEAKASKILLANGNYSVRFTNNTSFNVDNMTIVGMGDNVNLSVSSSEAWYGRIQGSNVTFKNIHFTSSVGATGEATYNNCEFDGWAICASSNNEKTYFNNCTINGCLNTSTDFSSGDTYVKDSTVAKAEYSGNATMKFENCTIGTLISWDMQTVLTGCTVALDDSHMTSNTIVVNP